MGVVRKKKKSNGRGLIEVYFRNFKSGVSNFFIFKKFHRVS